MKKTFVILSMAGLLSSCVQLQQNRDYVVKENSLHTMSAPVWITPSKAHKIDPDADTKQFLYVVSDGLDANQRVCLKKSEQNAMRKIAADTAEEIVKNLKKRNKKKNRNDEDPDLKDNLEKNVLVNLDNIETAGNYWEKRNYTTEKNTQKGRTSYKCHTVLKIKRSDVAKALRVTKAKINQKAAKGTKKALNSVIDSYIAESEVGK